MVIVGGGSAGWMAASILLHIMGRKGTRVTLIESSNVPTIGVGEGTVPLFRRFLEFLGITEAEFMQACHATYKHGINFPGWTGNDEFATYFHPFNTPAFASYEGDFFDHCNRRRRGEVIDTDPAGYFFNAELARQRKAPAGPPPADPRQVGYAYHFDAGLLAEFLKQRALRLGITHIIDDVTGVVTGENGTISHLVTAGHGNIIADFFIDCTGFARRLIGKCLGTDHLSYRPRMFNDSAVVMRSPLPPGEDIPPFTESRALRCGWAWRMRSATRSCQS